MSSTAAAGPRRSAHAAIHRSNSTYSNRACAKTQDAHCRPGRCRFAEGPAGASSSEST
eukprot:CAMPEP_0183447564 /NCGR_PEP_ID=MMETSP0370-20130417/103001_1 /TAXON_ID=268820 /ORGANISM="Peridinium aciculiferum, Strain PAER-2" /LENGTH=57 /DNA_ID=CAMNT_0025638433 /DNA_START=7 /DNA_END=177 /DNA_ORIENTATION=+